MKLWLDDKRPAPEGWTWVQTPLAACHYMQQRNVEEISLDHDLGQWELDPVTMRFYEVTGYDVLEAIERAAYEGVWSYVPKVIKIHSANAGIYKKMEQAIESIERMRKCS
jgi:hypothetical protein